jgi:hypothetical protein
LILNLLTNITPIQIDGDFRARPLQVKVAQEMVLPSSNRNTVLQLNMGEGKSSVIVPIVAATLADGKTLTRILVLKAFSAQMFRLLVNRLGGLANRRIFYLPFSRSVVINTRSSQIIENLHHQCMREGGILVAQPEHILSFKLMGIERLSSLGSTSSMKPNASGDLMRMQNWLNDNTRDILDESDEILHVRYQLIYTLGEQCPLEDHPDRWTTIQHVFTILQRRVSLLNKACPGEIEYRDLGDGQFPTIRVIDAPSPTVMTRLKELVAVDVLDGVFPNINITHLGPDGRKLVNRFLREADISQEDITRVQHLCSGAWAGLLLLRGLLAFGILLYVLREKRFRVNYGLDLNRCLLAVPYIAKVTYHIYS